MVAATKPSTICLVSVIFAALVCFPGATAKAQNQGGPESGSEKLIRLQNELKVKTESFNRFKTDPDNVKLLAKGDRYFWFPYYTEYGYTFAVVEQNLVYQHLLAAVATGEITPGSVDRQLTYLIESTNDKRREIANVLKQYEEDIKKIENEIATLKGGMEGQPSKGLNKEEGASNVPESDSVAKVKVPNVIGKPLRTAIATLKDNGLRAQLAKGKKLKIEDGKEADAAGHQPLDVYLQVPAGGAMLTPGEKVWIAFYFKDAEGKEEVPNVKGMTKDDAEAALLSAGFVPKPKKTSQPRGGSAKPQEVLSQLPDAFAIAPQGQLVQFIYVAGGQTFVVAVNDDSKDKAWFYDRVEFEDTGNGTARFTLTMADQFRPILTKYGMSMELSVSAKQIDGRYQVAGEHQLKNEQAKLIKEGAAAVATLGKGQFGELGQRGADVKVKPDDIRITKHHSVVQFRVVEDQLEIESTVEIAFQIPGQKKSTTKKATFRGTGVLKK